MKIKLVESNNELEQILELQNDNHYENIPPDLKNKNGFVTVRHNLELLLKMNDKAKQIIAVENGKVIGYALVMLKKFRNLIPVLVPMFDNFEDTRYKNSKLSNFNYYVMGQVCISEKHRGKGIFKSLYLKHREIYSSQFELCLTEVSSSNLISMKAHQKVGFKTISTFKDSTDEWNILAWDWK
ncbi:GNAT family N-acetyltransferase [Aquimarina algiphila]|uniref:GNAT family N-acetyltransferase n=1 Tax=Aquimarina algiphila TaxID=2047982 RepID=UPI00232F31A7|nr:GNAT family N-acetyltransferase [Aquimarina algiphila]